MKQEMKLQDKYFNYILNGTKRIEIRLYDEKRKQLKIGDTIIFKNDSDLNKKFEAKIIDLIKYNSFEEMFKDYDIDILADKNFSKKELMNELEKFYTKEKQKEYGVLAIKIKK